jgi:peptidoglycan/xylan/chitin deacetylase (PgdA/CDA1 family)
MVAITFDDGYRDNAEYAAPLLLERKLPASFFLATGFIGQARWAWVDRLEASLAAATDGEFDIPLLQERARLFEIDARVQVLRRIRVLLKKMPWDVAEAHVRELEECLGITPREPWGLYRFMSWDDARALSAADFEVGAHTVNHAVLSRVSLLDAEREITASRERIVAEVGACSATFCYPNGKRADYTPDVIEVCKRQFTAALSTESGAARPHELYELRRFALNGSTSEARLASIVVQAE